jgi:mono/diheme cytochrome c family protein
MKLVGVIIVLAIAAAVVFAVLPFVRGGISARREPSAVESIVARRLRRLAIPAGARDEKNPIPASPKVVAEGRVHFADHCAICHANDGSGDSEIGHGLYPKVPDMRKDDTQSLSDGELFYIIANGVRFTGMPAWGDGDGHDSEDNWELVHFIRHLPKITHEELEEMERLNPKSAAEEAEEKDERQFLGDEGSAPPAGHAH